MVEQEPKEYNCYVEDADGKIRYNPFKYCRTTIFSNSSNTSNKGNIIKLRLDLIKEELDELNDALNDKDIIEQRDACADILYVVYGMADVLGISIDDIFSSKMQEFESDSSLSSSLVSSSGSSIVSNFNKIQNNKIAFIGFDIQSTTTIELVEFINRKLINSYKELESNSLRTDEINNNNSESINSKFINIANNLYDLLSWTYMMTLAIGVNADMDFDIVHNSNMSKLCDTEADAIATVRDYEAKYRAGSSPYDSPYYYYLPNLEKWIIKNLSTGKALKNIKYKKVCFANPRFVF
jgi:predicted HAD superfamily Cof-like phosphohydrolase